MGCPLHSRPDAKLGAPVLPMDPLRGRGFFVPIRTGAVPDQKTKETEFNMSNKKETNRPTHSVYVIQGEGKSERWTKIGAAWPHKDGQGFSFVLDAYPAGNGRVAIRLNTEKDVENANGGQQ